MLSFWLLLFLIAAPFGVVILVKGAPFLPAKKGDVAALFDDLRLDAKDVFVDFGSGSGGVVRAARSHGAKATGFEINPFLIAYSRMRSLIARDGSVFKPANLWPTSVPPDTTHVYVFLLPAYMENFMAKVQAEITHPVTLISYSFPVKSLEPSAHIGNHFIYIVSPLDKLEANK